MCDVYEAADDVCDQQIPIRQTLFKSSTWSTDGLVNSTHSPLAKITFSAHSASKPWTETSISNWSQLYSQLASALLARNKWINEHLHHVPCLHVIWYYFRWRTNLKVMLFVEHFLGNHMCVYVCACVFQVSTPSQLLAAWRNHEVTEIQLMVRTIFCLGETTQYLS